MRVNTQCSYSRWTNDTASGTLENTYSYALFYGGLVQLLAGMWAVRLHMLCANCNTAIHALTFASHFLQRAILKMCTMMPMLVSLLVMAPFPFTITQSSSIIRAFQLDGLHDSIGSFLSVAYAGLDTQHFCSHSFLLICRILDGLWPPWHPGLGMCKSNLAQVKP